MSPKILFILKKRGSSYGDGTVKPILKSSGLLNSARFVHEMLVDNGLDSELVEVVDNNSIDREVTRVKPTHVIIEAVWVVPEKFEVLSQRHPNVKWIVRIHSEVPFLAGEGIAVRWALQYINHPNVVISFNSKRTNAEFQSIMGSMLPTATPEDIAENVVYLPNYYPVGKRNEPYRLDKKTTIDVGCFGAIRPLKNQLIQAVAAIEFAKKHNLKLNFHINATRVEGGGDNNAKNIKALFNALPVDRFKLVEHGWMEHSEFIEVIRDMDIGMQMSFTETFNIVSADFANNGVPIVVSSEVEWAGKIFKAKNTSSKDIVAKMERALLYKQYAQQLHDLNRVGLKDYSRKSRQIWLNYFK